MTILGRPHGALLELAQTAFAEQTHSSRPRYLALMAATTTGASFSLPRPPKAALVHSIRDFAGALFAARAPFAPTSEPAPLVAACLFFGHVRSLAAGPPSSPSLIAPHARCRMNCPSELGPGSSTRSSERADYADSEYRATRRPHSITSPIPHNPEVQIMDLMRNSALDPLADAPAWAGVVAAALSSRGMDRHDSAGARSSASSSAIVRIGRCT